MTLLFPFFLVPAVLCLAAFILWRRGDSDDWGRVLSRPVLSALRPGNLARRFDVGLLALAIVFAALASPALRADRQDSYALKDGMIVVVDVSKSMTLSDIAPTRIAAARAVTLQLSKAAGARPSALLAYAGDAYLVEPFATDRRQFEAYAVSLDVGLVPQEGSDLERALALVVSIIDQAVIEHARVVLISDGGGFDEETTNIARRMAQRGHRVDVVLVADPNTQAPVSFDLGAVGKLAEEGGGILVGVDFTGLADVSRLGLDTMSLDAGGTAQLAIRSTDWRNLSHWLLMLAAPLVLLLFRQVRP